MTIPHNVPLDMHVFPVCSHGVSIFQVHSVDFSNITIPLMIPIIFPLIPIVRFRNIGMVIYSTCMIYSHNDYPIIILIYYDTTLIRCIP